MKLLLMLMAAVALTLSGCARQKDLFKKDLSNSSCKSPVWSFNEKGELSSTKDEILWTQNEYENFILELEFMVTKAGNGGIIIYSTNTDNWIPDSIEIQIADNEHWIRSGVLSTCGAIFGLQAPSKDVTKPVGQWNTLKAVCKGKSVKVYINNELINDFDMNKFTDAKKNPDGSIPYKWLQSTPRAKVPTKGKIGFQGHHGNGDAVYRNLKITQGA